MYLFVMKPRTLKPWSYVKERRYDLSSLTKGWGATNPDDYYFQLDHSSMTYTPAVLKVDLDNLPEPTFKPQREKFH